VEDREGTTQHPKAWFGFSVALQAFADPLAATVWDRCVDGEERWRTFGCVAVGGRFMIVVAVQTYPDPDDETWVRVIGLLETTAHERRRHEISHR
jgi:uncharacterized DUF497 family protein